MTELREDRQRAWEGRVARLAWCGAGLVVLFLAAAIRLVAEGNSALSASYARWTDGDALGAVVHARRAAMAFFPGAPHVSEAFRRLRAMALSSEARGDREGALFAWRAVRAACMGSRPFSAGCGGARQAADREILRLSKGSEGAAGRSLSPSSQTGTLDAALLAAEVPPRLAWGGLLVAAAALWVAGGVRLATKAHDDHGRLNKKEASLAAAISGGGLLAWVLALFMA